MNELLEIERIKQLKGRYFRYLDGNEWQAMADEVFTEDAQGRYSDGDLSFDGRDAIIGFLSKFMDGPNLLTMHTGHHPEISLTSDTTATGIWYLHDVVIVPAIKRITHGNGIYHDEYRKVDGEWRVSLTGYQRLFEIQDALTDKFRIVKSKWHEGVNLKDEIGL